MIGEPKEIKIEATLNCIKDSEIILNGEYYVVHSDFIVALEEEIEKLNQPNIIVKVGDAKEVREKIETLQQKLQRKDNIINDAIKLCEEDAEAIWEYEGAYSDMFEEIRDVLKEKK